MRRAMHSFTNLKSQIAGESVEFKEAVKIVLGQEMVPSEQVGMLLYLLETRYKDKVFEIEYLPNQTKTESIPSELDFVEIVSRFGAGLSMVNNSYFNHVSSFITMYIENVVEIRKKGGECYFDKKLALLDKIFEIFSTRSNEEKDLFFVPSEVMDIMVELSDISQEEGQLSIIDMVNTLLRSEGRIRVMVALKKGLREVFDDLRMIILVVKELGIGLLEDLYEAAEIIHLRETKRVCEGESKTLLWLSEYLMHEIKKWVIEELDDLIIYFDPTSPKLASILVIKTPDSAVFKTERFSVDVCNTRILYEVLRSMWHSQVQANTVLLEIGGLVERVESGIWSLFTRTFKLSIIKCKVRFTPKATTESAELLKDFFLSKITETITQLSISPLINLGEPVMKALAQNLQLESLSLLEVERRNEVLGSIEDFLLWIFSNHAAFAHYLKYLTLIFPNSPTTLAALSNMVFPAVESFEINFLLNKGQTLERNSESQELSQLINKKVFPTLKEATVQNRLVSQQEVEAINANLKMVQTRHGRFYCPMGTSYIKQAIYTFKQAESMSLNAGIVFLIQESFVMTWLESLGTTGPRECMTCQGSYVSQGHRTLVIFPCGNIFHVDCASRSFAQKKNLCCSMCRKKVHMYKGLAMAVDTQFNKSLQDEAAPSTFCSQKLGGGLSLFRIE
ncbi:hypothetical protein NEHOM01_2441 [Nematocida homosporus]|uniref:uncharacterized protein n=1 Tax=Nematocida homosporus TaxID=1912981 RepID=UPI00222093FE|nr:uncharacterized protein NEHOM01_2441 [Nematocida homosporus]KAI5187912.1 hypothetical protein NEHOM01_2441 [Nematocida homosporus]